MTKTQREQIIKYLAAGKIQQAKALLNDLEDTELWFCDHNIYRNESGKTLSKTEYAQYCKNQSNKVQHLVFKSADSL